MLVDSTLTVAAILVVAGSNEKHRKTAVVVCVSFAMLQVYSDIFLKILQMTKEPVVYVAYSTIQIMVLIAFKYLKTGKILKILVASTLIVNSLVILHYIIVTNFQEMNINVHDAYNPIVWSLMVSQLIYLLWKEKDVVTLIRKQGSTLWDNCSISSLVRNMRSSRNSTRSYK